MADVVSLRVALILYNRGCGLLHYELSAVDDIDAAWQLVPAGAYVTAVEGEDAAICCSGIRSCYVLNGRGVGVNGQYFVKEETAGLCLS